MITKPVPLCDGSAEVRFAYNSTGGFVQESFVFTNPHGHAFLLVDGTCRFYAGKSYLDGIVSGTLSASDAATLSRDVHWDDLASWTWSVNKDLACPDAGGVAVMRKEGYGGCVCGCDAGAPMGLDSALSNANMWVDRLIEQGQPLEGPVTAIAFAEATYVSTNTPLVDWPLSRGMNSIAGLLHERHEPDFWMGNAQYARFIDPAEYQKLRDARVAFATGKQNGPPTDPWAAMPVREASKTYDLFVRDELPEAIVKSWEALRATLPKP